jgi:hypothetical protein
MQNTVTPSRGIDLCPNANGDDSRAILSEIAQDFDMEEEFTEEELDAMRDNAEREWFAECDAVRGITR